MTTTCMCFLLQGVLSRAGASDLAFSSPPRGQGAAAGAWRAASAPGIPTPSSVARAELSAAPGGGNGQCSGARAAACCSLQSTQNTRLSAAPLRLCMPPPLFAGTPTCRTAACSCKTHGLVAAAALRDGGGVRQAGRKSRRQVQAAARLISGRHSSSRRRRSSHVERIQP